MNDSIHLAMNDSIHLSMNDSIHLSMNDSIHLSMNDSIHLAIVFGSIPNLEVTYRFTFQIYKVNAYFIGN